MKKVLLLDTVHPHLPEGLRQMGYALEEDYACRPKDLRLQAYCGLVLRSRLSLGAAQLKGSGLSWIARVGAGLENIDLEAARAENIAVLNAPEGNRDAVGEHALGMLLGLFHRLFAAHASVQQGQWLREEHRGEELQGKCVGIIGYGHMGSAFAEKLDGLGVELIAYDKYKSRGYAGGRAEEVSLNELRLRAQVVSLHLPLTDETRGMVNDEFIAGFARPFYLINTARGAIVDTAALVRSLKNGRVAGACLDVLEYEKTSFESLFDQELPDDFRYLVKAPQVVLSPHVAGWSHQSAEKMARVLLQKIRALGNKPSEP